MPKIKTFAPSWLSKPAPGRKLFEPSGDDIKSSSSLGYGKKPKPGPRRVIAKRGTEIFVAVGKQIRWADLVDLKESCETKQTRIGGAGFEVYDEEAAKAGLMEGGYRIIKTPVAEDIRQLVMSPNQDFLAVLTSHNVHICVLPPPSRLSTFDPSPPKPRFFTLGPTIHVTSRSAVASAVWHPLGVNGTALVTVTEDAVVRMWELSAADRWSFDKATLTIDLKRLADGTCLDQDFSASVSATNKGFSPDMFDMEVAAACFPARDSGSWSPMTLWVAMTGGDVYALCPLLPQKWSPPPTLVPSLSVDIVNKTESIEADPEASPESCLLAQQQLEWMSDLDRQDPKIVEDTLRNDVVEVYTRPAHPGTVPRLQGPFHFDVNPEDEQDDEVELKDIFVIGQKVNTSELMMGEDEDLDDGEGPGLSLSVICLLSTSGQVKICLDLDGVEAKWLPPRSKASQFRPLAPTAQNASLLTFQTFDTVKPAELTPDGWPMFSQDPASQCAFYVTHPAGINHVNLEPWVTALEGELQNDSEAGAEFRLDLLVKQNSTERLRIFTQPPGQNALAAAVVIRDHGIGHLVLSCTHSEPITVFFEAPELEPAPYVGDTSAAPEPLDIDEPEPAWEPRPCFRPSDSLNMKNAIPAWHDLLRSGRRRPLLQQEVRLSPVTLEVLTEGHKVVASHVFELNHAVAELFRRCEALQDELKDEIVKVGEAKKRIDNITGEDSADDEPVSVEMLARSRLAAAQRKNEELAAKMEVIKKKMGRATTRELSDKERSWVEEVRILESGILGSEVADESPSSKAKQPWKRYEEIKELKNSLFAQAQKIAGEATDDVPASPAPNVKIPAEVRRAKLAQVMNLLDRESMLVQGLTSRLEKLTHG
ncbi:hypothetical protein QBC42DRAFT_208632 [Cladorrhinum samala]|uniref:Nucleoporin NUP82 n=1 Tax=Cladorrhinum samala TaxID=585594 RepID=A0AAV9HI39_9PEZI|nr:hypothetical protein QBC42DRAFT_208632 [Cladorrhinum samala]